MNSDFSKHDSSPECPSNFDCTLTLDTDTDPDDEGCHDVPKHTEDIHGKDYTLYATIPGITVVKSVTKDAVRASRTLTDESNCSLKTAFDKGIPEVIANGEKMETKIISWNRAKHPFDPKWEHEEGILSAKEASNHVTQPEGWAWQAGAYVRVTTTGCGDSIDHAFTISVIDKVLKEEARILQHDGYHTEQAGTSKTDPSGSKMSLTTKERTVSAKSCHGTDTDTEVTLSDDKEIHDSHS